MTLKFSHINFKDYFNADVTQTLDTDFLALVAENDKRLHDDLVKYRQDAAGFSALQRSELIIAGSKYLETFLIDFFAIEDDFAESQVTLLQHDPVFAFKKWIVLRRAKRRLLRDDLNTDFETVDCWLNQQIKQSDDKELTVAKFAVNLLADKEKNKLAIEQLTEWALHCLKTPQAIAAVKGWVSFKLPQRTNYKRLIPIKQITENSIKQILPGDQQHLRDGFSLTDPRMNERQLLAEIDYCIYCHDHDGDFCSIGFPEKKGVPELGFRKNPLGNTLTGCPLDEKISEMHLLKKEAHSIAALAAIMIDNPMCPATGHRICNDCMKACVYQKQDPVDIPQVETGVLSDVLNLPFGVEIYDLLTRWNPLRHDQYITKPYSGLKVFIAGLGPAGFTLAHHLLMEGCAIVGSDGLKIEELPQQYLQNPIKNYQDICEDLDTRIMSGFGGVAEYGITVRWDKNFLKLIYISLMRRPHFQVVDGVRFGGTVTVESLYSLGFDHISICVGAGLPKALPIPGSMARGMRQANDFLMALQLTGAAKLQSLANLQLRLPVVIIGGGLTGVDAATEAQAYYIRQVEKTSARYTKLCELSSEEAVRKQFDEESLNILDEFLNHAQLVQAERKRVKNTNEKPNFTKILHDLGGVSIVYRKNIEDAPAYKSNHEELHKAIQEGLFYLEGLQPEEVLTDQYGHCSQLVCSKFVCDEEGHWSKSDETITLEAKSILVATGASPNVAYDFEHHNLFKRSRMQYEAHELIEGQLQQVNPGEHVKSKQFGPFTSYHDKGHLVSFLGDVHPTFHGNVVGAIASAKRTYPEIMLHINSQQQKAEDYSKFSSQMQQYFTATVKAVKRISDNIVELCIHAPAAVENFEAGHFFRLQNYERSAKIVKDTLLQTEPLALIAAGVDKQKSTLDFIVIETGVSSRLCALLEPGDKVSLMGPTGVRSKLPDPQQSVLIVANQVGIAYALCMIPALKAKGHTVNVLGYFENEKQAFYRDKIEQLADHCIWSLDNRPVELLQEQDIINTAEIDRITVFGNACLLKKFQHARHTNLQLKSSVKIFGAVHSNMQCMLKGVCAQCLQWQIDPSTGSRKKAVFACSWQDQPLELIDFDNYAERALQNKMAETLSHLWLNYVITSGEST